MAITIYIKICYNNINKSARLDEMETAEAHRGKGYARQITRHMTKYRWNFICRPIIESKKSIADWEDICILFCRGGFQPSANLRRFNVFTRAAICRPYEKRKRKR